MVRARYSRAGKVANERWVRRVATIERTSEEAVEVKRRAVRMIVLEARVSDGLEGSALRGARRELREKRR